MIYLRFTDETEELSALALPSIHNNALILSLLEIILESLRESSENWEIQIAYASIYIEGGFTQTARGAFELAISPI